MTNVLKVEGLCTYPALVREDDYFTFLGSQTEIEPLLLIHIVYFWDNCGSISIKFHPI
jgi:hypothetical protein